MIEQGFMYTLGAILCVGVVAVYIVAVNALVSWIKKSVYDALNRRRLAAWKADPRFEPNSLWGCPQGYWRFRRYPFRGEGGATSPYMKSSTGRYRRQAKAELLKSYLRDMLRVGYDVALKVEPSTFGNRKQRRAVPTPAQPSTPHSDTV